MKIATYNLRKGGARRVHWVRLIEDQVVDLLLTQETYSHAVHLPADAYPEAATRTVWQAAARHAWGSAVYLRTGALESVPVRGHRGWVVGGEVRGASWQQGSSESLLVFSLHTPSGPGGYWGQVNRQLDALQKIIAGRPVILGGDFNVLVSPQSGAERPAGRRDLAIQARLADEFGLINCWHAAHPDLPPCQTLRWTGAPDIAYHCDGLFVPRAWQGRLKSCEVLAGGEWDQLSDHNPVVASFTD